MNLDLLIEASAVQGQLDAGIKHSVVASRSSLDGRALAVFAGRSGIERAPAKSPNWTKDEDVFLRSCLGILSEKDIADALGRTVTAVHIRWNRELELTAPSKNSEVLTCNQIANGLNRDGKSIALLIDRGILEGHRLPFNDVTRVVNRTTLLRFIVNPLNWVYFDPDRVGIKNKNIERRGIQNYDAEFWAHARKLVQKRKSLWDDKWLTIGQVAQKRNVSIAAVNKAIHEGKLKATDWGNWWVLRFVATSPKFQIQKYTSSLGKDSITLRSVLKQELF